ncbi:hypothetical protein [uncultured Jatrophihabitans sp.]|uniref:hypothetical protein n=1 Tax=uncultured Jatrophihabitans sp. TaxID=1610747 RepID=UPI0035C96981
MAKHYALASYADGGDWRETEHLYVPRRDTRLRLQSLMALGYTASEVAAATGLSPSHVCNLRTDVVHTTVHVFTADAVASAFRDRWDKLATGPQANRQRSKARRLGYLLPLEWEPGDVDTDDTTEMFLSDPSSPETTENPEVLDYVAIAEAIAGRRVTLTRAELSHAIVTLQDMGVGVHETAERLHTYTRLVNRYRARARQDAA